MTAKRGHRIRALRRRAATGSAVVALAAFGIVGAVGRAGSTTSTATATTAQSRGVVPDAAPAPVTSAQS